MKNGPYLRLDERKGLTVRTVHPQEAMPYHKAVTGKIFDWNSAKAAPAILGSNARS